MLRGDVYLIGRCSGCGLDSRSRPNRSPPRRRAWPACRTCCGLCHWWWCPQRGPRSAASRRRGDPPRPSPPSRAAACPATGSSRRSPACSASPCTSVTDTTNIVRNFTCTTTALSFQCVNYKLSQSASLTLCSQSPFKQCIFPTYFIFKPYITTMSNWCKNKLDNYTNVRRVGLQFTT